MERAYLFAVKGIQRYIFEGGKLKDMVGASELVDQLCRSGGNDLLDAVLKATDFPEDKRRFSRRAGGVFMLHYTDAEKDALKRFRRLWRLAVAMTAPGLEFVEAEANEADGELDKDEREQIDEKNVPFMRARKAAYDKAGLRENSLASLLPMAGPLVTRAQRTGLAAVPAEAEYKDQEDDEDVDAVTLRKRRVERHLWEAGKLAGVAERMTPPELTNLLHWPRNMEPPKNSDDDKKMQRSFPFKNRKRWVGVVHADISGLGELFRSLNERIGGSDDPASESLDVSRQIEDAMSAAAQYATNEVLVAKAKQHGGVVPARPILLGGDDLTVIVRADLAIDFAEKFLTKLEEQEVVGEKPLTACAGIAFLKSSQPFYMASRLAEKLCDHAKSKVKWNEDGSPAKPVSAIAFHRITASLIEDYEHILHNTRTLNREGHKYILTNQPYLVGAHERPGLGKLDDLRRLMEWIDGDDVSVGPLRNLESLLFNNFSDAKKGYERWHNGMKRKEDVDLRTFDDTLKTLLGVASSKTLPFPETGGATPIFDALDWREVA